MGKMLDWLYFCFVHFNSITRKDETQKDKFFEQKNAFLNPELLRVVQFSPSTHPGRPSQLLFGIRFLPALVLALATFTDLWDCIIPGGARQREAKRTMLRASPPVPLKWSPKPVLCFFGLEAKKGPHR
jgi:hypothetical protein